MRLLPRFVFPFFIALFFAGCAVDTIGYTQEELSTTCGGIAARPCERGKVCVDDPRDDCDPRTGGADCGGICRGGGRGCDYSRKNRDFISTSPAECAAITFLCADGFTPFFSECGCGCERLPEACGIRCASGFRLDEHRCACVPDHGGTPCGTNTCGRGQYCCNASCGICAPDGGVCIQLACFEPVPESSITTTAVRSQHILITP